jgi:hypothetical protein
MILLVQNGYYATNEPHHSKIPLPICINAKLIYPNCYNNNRHNYTYTTDNKMISPLLVLLEQKVFVYKSSIFNLYPINYCTLHLAS